MMGPPPMDVSVDPGSGTARISPGHRGEIRARFVADRLDGLSDEPRPGRPASVTAQQIEAVIVATLEETPKNATHKHATVQRWLAAHPRFTMHFTPTYSSWLNQVE